MSSDPAPLGGSADRARAPRAAGRDLPIAIAVGLTMAAGFLGTIFWHPAAFLTFVAALVLIAIVELARAFRTAGLRPATPVVIVAGLVMFAGAYLAGAEAQVAGVTLLMLGTLVWVLWDRDRAQVAGSVGATLLMGLWVPLLASFIALLLARDEGIWYVMATVALTVTNDIGAYGWGNALGSRKLAPSVSPAKTWEGFIGGVVTVLVLAGLGTARVPGFDVATALVLGAGVAVAGTAGDLAESLLKRDLGIKDLGTVLPGHGGVMDRVDALLFALPAAHFLLLAFGR